QATGLPAPGRPRRRGARGLGRDDRELPATRPDRGHRVVRRATAAAVPAGHRRLRFTGPARLMGLDGKVAMVTGGSRGLGRVMVDGFAAAGADVVVASRKQDACEAVAENVRVTHGRRALAIGCNVSHWDQCDALVDKVYAEFGRVDVLVNNAGLSPLYPSLDA